uniref:Uncharacterized protein ycf33 n=1 Tax=Caloglossa intermedia TaxID=100879 RepID=A0A1Z1M6R2_9FLOR|nr:hypothetical protein [Caloglossa intermedia]ARW61531.1 hypothetical protein [Caloglossa intermedia]
MIYNILENLYKFPRFLIAVLLGFFLTTLKPFFRALKNKKEVIVFIIANTIIIAILQLILRVMTK